MNLHDFFRSFMGFPPRSEPSFGDPSQPENGGFGRDDNPYEGSMFGDPWDMFRHLDSVFRNFGLTEFPPFPHGNDVPAIEGPGPSEPGHLRDHMLKVPDYREPFLNAPDMIWTSMWLGVVWTACWPQFHLRHLSSLSRPLLGEAVVHCAPSLRTMGKFKNAQLSGMHKAMRKLQSAGAWVTGP
uniref:HCLS1-associated protein X-1 n=1 Tax=Rhipicephalus zambeziensis TaxID=60191 RepID=A0A224Z084_9ACAR